MHLFSLQGFHIWLLIIVLSGVWLACEEPTAPIPPVEEPPDDEPMGEPPTVAGIVLPRRIPFPPDATVCFEAGEVTSETEVTYAWQDPTGQTRLTTEQGCLDNVQLADSGDWTLLVSNEAGTTPVPFSLTVTDRALAVRLGDGGDGFGIYVEQISETGGFVSEKITDASPIAYLDTTGVYITPDWVSSNGEWIVFASGTPAGNRIVKVRYDGTDREELNPSVSRPEIRPFFQKPTISPDGEIIAFYGTTGEPFEGGEVFYVYSMNQEGKNVHQETSATCTSTSSEVCLTTTPSTGGMAFVGRDDRGHWQVIARRNARNSAKNIHTLSSLDGNKHDQRIVGSCALSGETG